ncbi:hypothetical protein [Flavobacterium sp.]|uniref:hypothetical protein n=1 Tax=Flavobacterium sp. TaxID=239 RepID=UPI004047408B
MKQIHKSLIFLFTVISLSIFGQNDSRSIYGTGFNSVFKNLEYGNFSGTINGIVIIKDSENKKYLLDFQGSEAKLEIEKDDNEVYDISYKKYTAKTTSKKTTLKYKTYATANGLEIELNGEIFDLSLIDGACDLVINGLEYSYESEKNAEYLIIHFTKEVHLLNSYESKVRKKITIMPNSTIVFAINRNK